MNRILEFGKGLLGLFLFYFLQIGFQLLFCNILIKDNFLINNILYIIMELILVIVLSLMNYKKLKNDYAKFNENHKKYLKYGLKLWLIGLGIMMLSNAIIYNVVGNIGNNEELTFRGNFKDAFKNKNIFIIFTALLFAGVHVLNGITSPVELLYFIPYGALSLAFGKIYMETDNIYTTMVIHSIHNSLSIILMVLTSVI